MAEYQTLKLNSDFRRTYGRGKSAADPVLVTYALKNRIISDDLPELLENCSRIMILKDGRIVDELTADEASEKQILSKML